MTRYLLATLLFISTTALAQNSSAALTAFAGHWTTYRNGTTMGEYWVPKDAHTWLGKSYQLAGSDTVFLETVVLAKQGEDVIFTALAFGQNNNEAVSFKLTSYTNGTFTFENPRHDYPKRIIYQFTGAGQLDAYVDDGNGGNRLAYHYQKK
jgi:hypothetical protein